MIRIALLIALLNIVVQLRAQRNGYVHLMGCVWQPDGSLLSFRQLSFDQKQPDLDIVNTIAFLRSTPSLQLNKLNIILANGKQTGKVQFSISYR